ncbi:PAS domain S-box protein [Brevibacillus dissolubilis]|uniref:PAS domain S-box protein n=1 Tax=Brevibacillus dissolubilis TaxID=1844116 RepID=UPI00159BE77B|nr:PAS domain S-box protein [Brevibacillus dissolubilis]
MKKSPTSTQPRPTGLLEQILAHTPAGVMAVDTYGVIHFCNEMAASLFGSTIDEVMLQKIYHFIPDIRTLADGLYPTNGRHMFQAQRQDGSIFQVGLKINTFVYDDTCYFLAVMEDIPETKEQKKTDEQRQFKFTSLFELHPDAAFSLDREGRFQRVNAAFERITGYSSEEILQTECFSLVVPEERPRTYEMYYRILAGETIDFEIVIQNKAGELLDIHITGIPIMIEHTSIGIYIVAKDITEQKQTRDALQQAQRELKEMVQEQQVILFKYKKINGKFIHTVAAGELLEQLKADPVMMIGRELSDFVPESLAIYAQSFYQQAWEGEAVSFEITTGSGRTLLTRLKPIYRDGEILEVLGSAVDITCLKKAEEELRSTKELLESFINHTTDGIVLMDCDFNTLLVNRAIEKISGWSEAEIVGKRLLTVPTFLLEQEMRIYEQVKAGAHVSGYQTVRQRKDGSLFHASVTLSAVRDANGHIVGISGILRDISERIHMEEKLRKSEQKYRLIADNVNDLISLVDIDGTIRYASPSHQTVLGLDPDWLEGKYSFDMLHPTMVEKAGIRFQEMAKTKTPVFTEFRQRHGSGEYLVIEASLSPITNELGQVTSILVVSRDITERKRTEELLRNSEKLSAIGQLAAGIAHEIRNPLTSLRGFIQLMQTAESPYQSYFDIMISELDRINFIVSELLFLAKPQVSHFSIHQPAALLQDVISLMESQAIMNNVQIITHFEPDVPDLFCEDKQLKQVFINLLKNSLEAMPTGGELHIHLQQKEPGHIQISFIDQGCGIPQERLPKLGEPFYTTKEKGTGLGLMVTYKIIRDHMGSIEFASEVEKGTTVDVVLPAGNQDELVMKFE